MSQPAKHRIQQGLSLLRAGLGRLTEEMLVESYGSDWVEEARANLNDPAGTPLQLKTTFALLLHTWQDLFEPYFEENIPDPFVNAALFEELRLIGELKRKPEELSLRDQYRLLDSIARLLESIGAPECEKADLIRVRVMKAMVENSETSPTEIPEQNEATDPGLWGKMKVKFTSSGPIEPLERRNKILFELERILSPYRDLETISFSQIDVHIVTDTLLDQTVLTDYFVVNRSSNLIPALERHLKEANLESFITFPIEFHVDQQLPEALISELNEEEKSALDEKGFLIRLRVKPRPARKLVKARLEITVGVPIGGRTEYTLHSSDRITNIGRMQTVYGVDNTVRYNQIAFEETAPENAEVSRAHACIKFDTESGQFQIKDEGSTYGTAIIRGPAGHSIIVRRHYRGLEDGDEIQLGPQARLLFHATP